jgi:FG-GAP-like repeat
MSSHSWLQNLHSALAPHRAKRHRRRRGSFRAAIHRLNLDVLEDRCLLSFSPATTYPVGAYNHSQAVVTGDFNNDRELDLATANQEGTVSELLGNGDGTFQTALSFATGANPRSLAVADFNNDGNLDLATVNAGDNTVSMLLGKGDGSFRPPMNAAILPGASEVAAADFNGDAYIDVVYASSGLNGGWGSAEVLLGDGRGGFVARHQYQIHTQNPTGLAVADLNADGRPDLVTKNLEYTASVLLGKGDGTLRARD